MTICGNNLRTMANLLHCTSTLARITPFVSVHDVWRLDCKSNGMNQLQLVKVIRLHYIPAVAHAGKILTIDEYLKDGRVYRDLIYLPAIPSVIYNWLGY